MMRLAGGYRLGALIALGSLSGAPALRAEAPWLQISIDPSRDVEVGWAEGEYDGDQVRFENLERVTFVLTNRSTVSQAPPELTIASSDPSRFRMVTLTAISGPTTHMTSVMNPTGFDVLSFGPRLALGAGESLSVTVEATPQGG